jgi:hypothetical protein
VQHTVGLMSVLVRVVIIKRGYLSHCHVDQVVHIELRLLDFRLRV